MMEEDGEVLNFHPNEIPVGEILESEQYAPIQDLLGSEDEDEVKPAGLGFVCDEFKGPHEVVDLEGGPSEVNTIGLKRKKNVKRKRVWVTQKSTDIQRRRKRFRQAKPGVGANVTHWEITCDGCDMYPIVGFRYKCAVCDDYDLCGSCKNAGKHPEHNMRREEEKEESEEERLEEEVGGQEGTQLHVNECQVTTNDYI